MNVSFIVLSLNKYKYVNEYFFVYTFVNNCNLIHIILFAIYNISFRESFVTF